MDTLEQNQQFYELSSRYIAFISKFVIDLLVFGFVVFTRTCHCTPLSNALVYLLRVCVAGPPIASPVVVQPTSNSAEGITLVLQRLSEEHAANRTEFLGVLHRQEAEVREERLRDQRRARNNAERVDLLKQQDARSIWMHGVLVKRYT